MLKGDGMLCTHGRIIGGTQGGTQVDDIMECIPMWE